MSDADYKRVSMQRESRFFVWVHPSLWGLTTRCTRNHTPGMKDPTLARGRVETNPIFAAARYVGCYSKRYQQNIHSSDMDCNEKRMILSYPLHRQRIPYKSQAIDPPPPQPLFL